MNTIVEIGKNYFVAYLEKSDEVKIYRFKSEEDFFALFKKLKGYDFKK